jgi:trimeric autotransporter adhesin
MVNFTGGKKGRTMNSLIQFKQTTPVFLVAFTLACFGLLPQMRAAPQVAPAPDGCYPNFTTAEGCDALNSLTTGAGNTGLGWRSLFLDSTGSFNTGVGGGALALNNGDSNTAVGAAALLLNTTGTENTATGTDALVHNDSGTENTANGAFALFSNTTGSNNTATGDSALFNNTIGEGNTANGVEALFSNIIGNQNTANGFQALFANTMGAFNTANGFQALGNNTEGGSNTANGRAALLSNTIGDSNTATGGDALRNNTEGDFNTAVGESALRGNTTGVANTATGYQTLMIFNGSGNTANGYQALLNHVTGNDNVAIGALALQNNTIGGGNIALGTSAGANIVGDSNIDIGNAGIAADSHTTRIGDISQTKTFISGIRGVTTGMANAIPVVIDAAGQLGTMSSSLQFKTDVKPIDKTSESILALKPVSFRYKVHKDTTPQFGLIAEEVAEVNPDLVIYDSDGKPYTVRYDAVNAMLLNEFLKEHRKVGQQASEIQEQKASIAELKSIVAKQERGMETLAAHMREQDSQIQKVSAQLETSKPAPQVANNHQ